MTRQRSHRLAAEDGFTLTELLVAMSISLVVLLATLGALDAFNSGVAANNRLTDAADTARRQVATMVSGLRDATAVSQIPPAGTNDLVFSSTSWPGESAVGVGSGSTHIERYCLDTATRKLWFNGLKAGTSGNATPGACGPSPGTGWTSALLASNVLNTAADPLFVGSAWRRTVSINLRLESGTALKSRTLELRSGGMLRGVLDPQVTAADITMPEACAGGERLLSLDLAALPGTNGAKMSAPGSIPAGPGRIFVPATTTPTPVTVRITNLLGRYTDVIKTVSC
jgi:prepilin-type N-terminal cleavage/methylation domain-containing protein